MVVPARVSIFTRPLDVEAPVIGGQSAGVAQASVPPPITAAFFPTARRDENIRSARSASPVGRHLQASRSPSAAVQADGRVSQSHSCSPPQLQPASSIQPNVAAHVARHVEPVRTLQMPHLPTPVLRHVVRPMTSQPVNQFIPMLSIPESFNRVSPRIAPQFQETNNLVQGGFPPRCQSFAPISTPYHAPMPDRCIGITNAPRCQSFAPTSTPHHTPMPDPCLPRTQSFAPTSAPYHAAAPAPRATVMGATIFTGQSPGRDQRQAQVMHRATTFAAPASVVVQRAASFATHAPSTGQMRSPQLLRVETFAPSLHRNVTNVVPVAQGLRPATYPQNVQIMRRTHSFIPGNYPNVGDDISHEARLNEMQRAVAQCA